MTTPISLTYRGDGAIRPGLPARDIDSAELASIALVRKADVDSVADEAIGSGLYLGVYAEGEGYEAPVDRHDVLEHMTKAELRDVAAGLGLELPKSATNAALVDAIEAEEQRLADEAATAKASGSGEGDQGGDATPADDSGATTTDEAGTPPSDEVTPLA